MTLLSKPEQRERQQLKRRSVLRFLRDEIYSTREILGLVMGISDPGTIHRTLVSMEREELLRRQQFLLTGSGKIELWGITAHGQAHAQEGDEEFRSRVFQDSKVGKQIEHYLGLQKLRVLHERAGVKSWLYGDRNRGRSALNALRPDALYVSRFGERIALEYERTLKTPARYHTAILPKHLSRIALGEYKFVNFVCSTEADARRLQKIFQRRSGAGTLAGIRVSSFGEIASQLLALQGEPDRERNPESIPARSERRGAHRPAAGADAPAKPSPLTSTLDRLERTLQDPGRIAGGDRAGAGINGGDFTYSR